MSDPLNSKYVIGGKKKNKVVLSGVSKQEKAIVNNEPITRKEKVIEQKQERVKQKQRNLVENTVSTDNAFIEIEDIDYAFVEYIKNNFQIDIDGDAVPIIPMALSLYTQIIKTGDVGANLNKKNLEPPFIAYVRDPNVQTGTYLGEQGSLPPSMNFTYSMCTEVVNGKKQLVRYKVPQPTPVDITYTVSLICKSLRDINKLNQIVLKEFRAIDKYINVKQRHMPTTLQTINDSSELDISKRKFFKQDYSFLIKGFIICKEDVQKCVAPSEIKLNFETKESKKEVFSCYTDKKGNSSSMTYCFDFGKNRNKTCDVTSKYSGIILSSNIKDQSKLNIEINDCKVAVPFKIHKGDNLRVEHLFDHKESVSIKFYGNESF